MKLTVKDRACLYCCWGATSVTLWPTGTCLLSGRTLRKHQEGLVLPQNSLGRAAEWCLRWPVQTDLACSPSMAGTCRPNMAGRQEKKNSPLCLVWNDFSLWLLAWDNAGRISSSLASGLLYAYVLYGMNRCWCHQLNQQYITIGHQLHPRSVLTRQWHFYFLFQKTYTALKPKQTDHFFPFPVKWRYMLPFNVRSHTPSPLVHLYPHLIKAS